MKTLSLLCLLILAWPLTSPPVPAALTPRGSKMDMTDFAAPANLRVLGRWDAAAGKPTDLLRWDAVAEASSYNVYQYGQRIGTTRRTSFQVPSDRWNVGLTYTVTAIDAHCGCESIPSAPAQAQGGFMPGHTLPWASAWVPAAPDHVAAAAEWNIGKPRIRVTWQHGGSATRLYRDGVLITEGLTRPYYLDSAVQPGHTYSYVTQGVNTSWPGGVAGPKSQAASGTAPVAAPTLCGSVTITKIVAGGNSAVVFFNAVPGAADYRVYDTAAPTHVKYSGGSLSIEQNGLDPARPHRLVVEAVDKLGPYQKMDGDQGIGQPAYMSTNGQGDPSNVPQVLAVSAPIPVTLRRPVLSGTQVFFDNFNVNKPFKPVPKTALDPQQLDWNHGEVAAVENDKWRILNLQADLKSSVSFFMGRHFMDTLYDGPYGGHNNNASLVMLPRATADISGGKVLHVTFEVDAHFGGRRWCDVFVLGAGDTILNAGKFFDSHAPPTKSGRLLRWEIQQGGHDVTLFVPGVDKDGQGPSKWVDLMQLADYRDGDPTRRETVGLNGTTGDLDKRHRFDLYLSRNRFRIVETTEDGTEHIIRDKRFPPGVTLPWTRVQVAFVHQLYHTGNDHTDLVVYHPEEAYWINYRPWADERHWNNMGFEVLRQFPS